MSDCLVVINADRTIQFMSSGAEENFGSCKERTCQDMLGKEESCKDCMLPTFFSEEITNEEYVETRNIGNREFEITTAPMLNPDGTRSVIKVFRDITEQKKLEEEITQAKVRIETLNESELLKTELLSMVCHELRTPLSVIKGNITALLGREKWSEVERRDFLSDINQETDYLTRLVAKLLDMSRLEAGGMQMEKDWYDVSEIVEWADATLKTIVKRHSVEVSIPDDLPPVYVDRVRIGQVLVDLCENAARYSDEGSIITIEAELSDDSIVMSVTDTGTGIDLEDIEYVFDRFYRTRSRNSPELGIGLGLSICRGIVETHGGKIWVQSQVREGSKFSFELPLGEREGVYIKPG